MPRRAHHDALSRAHPHGAQIEAFERANSLVLRLVGWMAIPCAILFSLVAHPLVRLVYGSKWDAAIPLLPYALAGGTAGALYQATTMLMLADVQHRGCAVAELLTLASIVICLFAVLPHGIAPYLGAVALVQSIVLLWMLRSLTRTAHFAAARSCAAWRPTRGRRIAAWLACAAAPPAASVLSVAGVSVLFGVTYGYRHSRLVSPRIPRIARIHSVAREVSLNGPIFLQKAMSPSAQAQDQAGLRRARHRRLSRRHEAARFPSPSHHRRRRLRRRVDPCAAATLPPNSRPHDRAASRRRKRLQAFTETHDGVEFAPALLGPAAAQSVTFYQAETGSSVLRDPGNGSAQPAAMEMTTLDALVRATPFERADFLKLDVQGYELEVLKGADRC
jgi:hypothetical protein